MNETPQNSAVGPLPNASNALHVQQYVALRNELRGYQQDEATLVTTSLAAVGTIVTIAAWQGVILLLALVPMFLYVTWRKITAVTANTFRTASFIKTYYEHPPDKGALCWEHAIEIWRLHRTPSESSLSWRTANLLVIRVFMLIAGFAALSVLGTAWIANSTSATAREIEHLASVRSVYQIDLTGSLLTPDIVKGLKSDADRVYLESRTAASRGMYYHTASTFLVWVTVGAGLWMTRGSSATVGERRWRQDADSRMSRIRSGELTLPT